MGKYTKSAFPDQENKAHTVLERIHYDFCGPFSIASTARHKYFVIFIDEFSWNCWIFFIWNKDETFSKFVEFKTLVENEASKKVKALLWWLKHPPKFWPALKFQSLLWIL